MQWHEVLAASCTSDQKYIITSPNTDWIPEPLIGLVKVFLRSDYRYGSHDPFQWPQNFSNEMPFISAVLREEQSPFEYSCLWWTPSEEQFRTVEGCIFTSIGVLEHSALQRLRDIACQLEDEAGLFLARSSHPVLKQLLGRLHTCLDRLRFYPCTFRDVCFQVREAQRSWLMCRAFIDFSLATNRSSSAFQPLQTRFMGAFTTSPDTVQLLHSSGIPVWFIRPDASVDMHTIIHIKQPTIACRGIEQSLYLGGTEPIYSGLSDGRLVEAVCRQKHMYVDVSVTPILVRYDAESYVHHKSTNKTTGKDANASNTLTARGNAHSQPHPTQIRGRDKFLDPVHDWMPPSISAWKAAMESADRSCPQCPSDQIWGYWVPEPALLLGPSMEERVRLYIMSWLRIRPAWLYLLPLPDSPVTKVRPQWWRDILNNCQFSAEAEPDSRREKRQKDISAIFGVILDCNKAILPAGEHVGWFDHRVSMGRIQGSNAKIILYEIFELGFRYELLALDRILHPMPNQQDAEIIREQRLAEVFAGRDLYRLHEEPKTFAGLGAEDPQDPVRVRCLEALRRVVSEWPLCPPDIVVPAFPIGVASPLHAIRDMERKVAAFYIKSFFTYAGRAPLVPHRFPLNVPHVS
ncbi:uncharacterized protein BXZ73DRAFT_47780 [Epithele typhae]|uniref:uncharacterized protein n=1 Tax=Epithele typhae TaxID=378194 RepID=UPI002007FB7B|nr:uncharacterized protein BXZ73DRAFT_47780 [Epithele typhae]KAH9929902.1 hypothetical protein BXZ73DRAFT_47780 [Epithele typhae]